MLTVNTELFWSGKANTNVTTALPRLHALSYRMRQRGTGAIALQPEYCAINDYACDLTA
jgi:hexosaminidase